MLLNLDKCEIEAVVLGSKTDLNEGTHEKDTYSFFVENGRIKHMTVRLGEFYSKGSVFKGDIQINSKVFKADNSFLPKVVLAEFENEISRWNDGLKSDGCCAAAV